MDNLVTIKTYKIGERGERGLVITLPKVWANSNNLGPGDRLDFMQAPGSADLVIRIACAGTEVNRGNR